MADPAAFSATYSDWRLIRSRKVVQIVLEVPLEAADRAYEVLGGMPNPAAETWCGVARINPQREGSAIAAPTAHDTDHTEPSQPAPVPTTPARASRPFIEMPYSEQAGMLCNDMSFRKFLREKAHQYNANNAETAKQAVRRYCTVESLTEILPSTEAENRWNLLVSAYRAWERAPSCGVA